MFMVPTVTILGVKRRGRFWHYIVDSDGWVEEACTGNKLQQLERYSVKARLPTCLRCVAAVLA